MEDALERRALLLHLGRVMQLIVRLDETAPAAATIGQLIAQNPLLEDEPLLEQLRPDLSVDEFRTQALHAFCLWPQWLLEAPLDRAALAASVRDHLFSDNPRGWQGYVSALRGDVAWFDAKPAGRRRPSRRVGGGATSFSDDEPPAFDEPAARGVAMDVERGSGGAGEHMENVEGSGPRDAGRPDEQRVPPCE